MDNRNYARILEEIAALMQIDGANPFRVRAFENAAGTIAAHPEPIEDILDTGDVTDLDGIGEGIAGELEQIRTTGSSPHRDELLERLPAGLLDLLQVQGLGPKRIRKLYDELQIADLDDLRAAAAENHIRQISGFGPKTEQKIADELQRLDRREGRIPLPRARGTAESLRKQLADVDGADDIRIAGSVRRQRETIGDIDLLAATTSPEPLHRALSELLEVEQVLATGDTKTSVRLRDGTQVDLRTVDPDVLGSALHYFTGSKEHHVKLRSLAKRQGLKISEYGVFRQGESEPIASRTEQEIYGALDLQYVPPELREGRDEIDRAADGRLPDLIGADDVRGDLHMHTTETDGRASIAEMADAAAERGCDYIAITDHSRAVRVADGMDADRFAAQIDDIRRIDADRDDIRVLSGIEVDILQDGTLDMEPELLDRCDWVVASIHSHFQMSSAEMTDRLLAAIDTGRICCLGHPTGRILGGRDGYDYDFETVVEAAADAGVALELNGSSGRLDLNAARAERARQLGAMLTLGSDAHSRRGLRDMVFAVGQARRAGLEADDVLNCRSASGLLQAVGRSVH